MLSERVLVARGIGRFRNAGLALVPCTTAWAWCSRSLRRPTLRSYALPWLPIPGHRAARSGGRRGRCRCARNRRCSRRLRCTSCSPARGGASASERRRPIASQLSVGCAARAGSGGELWGSFVLLRPQAQTAKTESAARASPTFADRLPDSAFRPIFHEGW